MKNSDSVIQLSDLLASIRFIRAIRGQLPDSGSKTLFSFGTKQIGADGAAPSSPPTLLHPRLTHAVCRLEWSQYPHTLHQADFYMYQIEPN